MIVQLSGFNPLQNKILMYCLGSPTAAIMKPVCELREDKICSENELTAWRYYKAPGNVNIYKKSWSFLGLCVIEDLRMIKEKESILKVLGIKAVENLYKAHLKKKLLNLNEKEKNGTPTGIVMRNYMANLFSRGLKLMDNETMWARFSHDKLSARRGKSLAQFLRPEVKDELTKALEEKNVIYKKNRAKKL
jgi:hypothetical protein